MALLKARKAALGIATSTIAELRGSVQHSKETNGGPTRPPIAMMAYPTTPYASPENITYLCDYVTISKSLSLIETVKIDRIVKRNELDYFVLNVHLHTGSQKPKLILISPTEIFFRTRNPLLSPKTSKERLGEPDFQVERRFAEFVELRHALCAIATAAHQHSAASERKCCVFCRPLLKYLHYDFRCPRTGLKLIVPSRIQMRYFAAFVRKLITMVVHVGVGHQPYQQQQAGSCDAVFQAATVLEEFLRKPRQLLCLGII